MDQTEENEERKEMGLGGASAGGPGFSIKGGTNSEFAFNPYQGWLLIDNFIMMAMFLGYPYIHLFFNAC